VVNPPTTVNIAGSSTVNVPVVTPIVVPTTTPVPVTVPTPIAFPTPISGRYAPGYQPPKQLIGGAWYLPASKTKKEVRDIKSKNITGYEVEIRRRRKFQPITDFAFATKEEAIQFGAKKTLETAAATFRVKPSAKPVKEIRLSSKINLQSLFRAPKRKEAPDTYVQLGKKRITSIGEKKEISYAGIASRKGKTKPTSFLKSKQQNKSMKGTFFKK
jgi:hypothetical protein